MSYSTAIVAVIEQLIGRFISDVSTSHGIDEDVLYNIWNTGFIKKSPASALPPLTDVSHVMVPVKTTLAPAVSEDPRENELKKIKTKELAEICVGKNLKRSGTKKELIQRIIDSENGVMCKTQTTITPPAVAPVSIQRQTPVVQQTLKQTLAHVIRKNIFGNYEHIETGLVFNKLTMRVQGIQLPTGCIGDLTTELIDLCNKFKFKYEMPENLNRHMSAQKAVPTEDTFDEDDGEEYEEVLEEEMMDEESKDVAPESGLVENDGMLEDMDDEEEMEMEMEEEEEEEE